jgi:signal transduction histidine kinase
MLADSDRLLNTVEQVLQAGRAGEKKRRLQTAELEIGSLLNDSIAIVRTRYNLDEGVIRIADIPHDLRVLGDEDELKTAFVNLLDNAVKYSGDERRISVRAKKATLADRVDIFIRDNGIGIPAAELKRIFKRFYRVTDQSVKDAKGTGLGLAIVRSIIEKHGGRVRADSLGEGRGTTFIVQLPLSNKL